MLSRLKYYLSSIPTLLYHIKNWSAFIAIVAKARPTIVKLRNGQQVKVRSLMDIWIVKETCLDKDYEVNGVPIADGWQVVDIGAGLGDFVLSAANERPNCKIWAFEPFPESFELLQENIALNQIKNVQVVQTAVSSQSGPMKMFLTGAAVQHIASNEYSPDSAGNAHEIEVQSQSINDLFSADGMTHCNFLKMDCEGGEFDILLNAKPETLAKIHHICLEYHDNATSFSHVDLEKFLKASGFNVRTTQNPVHHYLGFLYAENLRFEA